MRSDYADRAWLLAEQSGYRCETPAPSSVPTVRHHPDVLRRQQAAHEDAIGGGVVSTVALVVIGAGLWVVAMVVAGGV